MTKPWSKLIRDPVHNIIPFEDTPCDRLLLALINTREFQRLRRIKQLGFTDMVFPGGNHSRFAHSIGVMHTARLFLDRIQRLYGKRTTDEHRMLVTVAALLHDVGHGPFSHAFEKVTGDDHERRTLEIIRDDATEVHQKLREIDKRLPEQIGSFFDKNINEDDWEDADLPAFLTQVVSSQLDADRFDYLIRDSAATGTEYGDFDLRWLLQHLYVKDVKVPRGHRKKGTEAEARERGRFYLSSKAVFAAESYVFARYHMYRTVYFHKTTRAAEVMLRLVFGRYRDLLAETTAQAKRQKIVPGVPAVMLDAFADTKRPIALQEFLLLDDFSVTEFLKCCGNSADSWLQQLGRGLVDRKLYKAVDATDAIDYGSAIGHFTAQAREKVRALGLDPDLAFVDDTPADTPYKPYDPDSEKPASQIYIENSLGQLRELSTMVEAVDSLKKKYTLVRYYFPESIREAMDGIAAVTLRKAKP